MYEPEKIQIKIFLFCSAGERLKDTLLMIKFETKKKLNGNITSESLE
jgi:hypothetical protein